jgi:hypothetical protein
MAVTAGPSKFSYTGDGVSTAFAFSAALYAEADLVVTLVDTLGVETVQVLTTNYTVAIAAGNGSATVTFVTAPTNLYEVVIRRVTPYTQVREFGDTTFFDTAEIEQAFDEIALRAKELSDRVDLAIVPDGESATSPYDVNSRRVANLATPTTTTDAASKSYVDGAVVASAFSSTLGGAIAALAAKAAPVDADVLAVADSAAANLGKKVTLAQFRTAMLGAAWSPPTSDGATLGTASLMWSDLFLAAGSVVNWNNGDVTLTHATGKLTLAGGYLDMSDNLLVQPEIKDYSESVNAIGSIGGGTQDIDLQLGNVVSATVDTSATTFTFSNPPATGKAGSFTLFLTNGGSQTVTWPASVDWSGGVAPTLTTSGVDVLTFTTIDGGTTWYGAVVGVAFS